MSGGAHELLSYPGPSPRGPRASGVGTDPGWASHPSRLCPRDTGNALSGRPFKTAAPPCGAGTAVERTSTRDLEQHLLTRDRGQVGDGGWLHHPSAAAGGCRRAMTGRDQAGTDPGACESGRPVLRCVSFSLPAAARWCGSLTCQLALWRVWLCHGHSPDGRTNRRASACLARSCFCVSGTRLSRLSLRPGFGSPPHLDPTCPDWPGGSSPGAQAMGTSDSRSERGACDTPPGWV